MRIIAFSGSDGNLQNGCEKILEITENFHIESELWILFQLLKSSMLMIIDSEKIMIMLLWIASDNWWNHGNRNEGFELGMHNSTIMSKIRFITCCKDLGEFEIENHPVSGEINFRNQEFMKSIDIDTDIESFG
jgi:hypothetical protein